MRPTQVRRAIRCDMFSHARAHTRTRAHARARAHARTHTHAHARMGSRIRILRSSAERRAAGRRRCREASEGLTNGDVALQ